MNSFWIEIIGSTQAWISFLALILSVLSYISVFPVFESKSQQTRTRCHHLFSALSITAKSLILAVVYLGRAVKRPECAYLVDLFLSLNSETFFVSAFRREYPGISDRSAFVDSRTRAVHDAGICVVVFSFLLDFVFVHREKPRESAAKSDRIDFGLGEAPDQTLSDTPAESDV
jgi:hypothetical protein